MLEQEVYTNLASALSERWHKNQSIRIAPIRPSKYSDAELFPRKLQNLLASLHEAFESERKILLLARQEKQLSYDEGQVPKFLVDHSARKTGWRVAEIPADLRDRRVEITGPISSAKMVINMLSANQDGDVACTAMLDFEDSMKPTWENVVSGIENIIGVAKLDLTYEQVLAFGKTKIYKLDPEKMARPMVRVRGLHLNENHAVLDNVPLAAGLFDLAVTAYHTAQLFLDSGKTPKFYVPKCENYLEARWWNDVFRKIEDHLSLPHGTLKVTFLIETLPAAFQMEEILFEIRERACGLNGGRWDKIFSDIKTLKNHKDRVLADRATIDMTKPWMDNYAKLLIKICHKRGAFAMGGMSAFTPGKDPIVREFQMQKLIKDKVREATIGHDGCWVSHPYFISAAKSQFKKVNQLDVMHGDFPNEPELLPDPTGPKTLDGLRQNIRVGIAYQHGRDKGLGCVSFENLMEDLATLEISRAQVWQWLYHQVILDDGTVVNEQLIKKLFTEECLRIIRDQDAIHATEIIAYHDAKNKIQTVFLKKELSPFFTTN